LDYFEVPDFGLGCGFFLELAWFLLGFLGYVDDKIDERLELLFGIDMFLYFLLWL
jgi:hypothetical protein